MFYDDFCKTELQKTVFRELLELSKGKVAISIQELDHLGFDRSDIEETLIYFNQKGLLASVYSTRDSVPVIFSIG